ncbi:synaptobrevin-like protein ykt6 [Gigaspora rosea]|uniref:Synaptobrevin homolog YKT6 n=1 Tax=Gigaspora rosea TaxID=44941 RepID=A0A397VPH3_9GLOM|nr:synaptobrevin-like protein ykt6 [Gigaspora rosea]
MKIYSITVFSTENEEAVNLTGEYELSGFGFFQRGSVQEFMKFFSKTVAERTRPGQRLSVEENNYIFYSYARTEGIAGVIICDNEYPQRVALSLLSKILDEFLGKFARNTWKPQTISYPELKNYLIKYQDPKEADQIIKVQEQLDETKQVMNKTIESLLQRGEKLDDLIDRSQEISFQSKAFYKQARKTNSCCTIS